LINAALLNPVPDLPAPKPEVVALDAWDKPGDKPFPLKLSLNLSKPCRRRAKEFAGITACGFA